MLTWKAKWCPTGPEPPAVCFQVSGFLQHCLELTIQPHSSCKPSRVITYHHCLSCCVFQGTALNSTHPFNLQQFIDIVMIPTNRWKTQVFQLSNCRQSHCNWQNWICTTWIPFRELLTRPFQPSSTELLTLQKIYSFQDRKAPGSVPCPLKYFELLRIHLNTMMFWNYYSNAQEAGNITVNVSAWAKFLLTWVSTELCFIEERFLGRGVVL